VPDDLAAEIGAAHDRAMSRYILDLLPDLPEDEPMSIYAAQRLGAATARLDDLGHCWIAQDPGRVAAVLRSFWATLGR